MFTFEVVTPEGRDYVQADDFALVDLVGTVDFFRDGKIDCVISDVLCVRRVA